MSDFFVHSYKKSAPRELSFVLVTAGSDVIVVVFRGLLGLVFSEFVLFFSYEIARKIILMAVVVFIIVRIFVSAEQRTLQMQWNLNAPACGNVITRRVVGKIRGVGLGRCREHTYGIGKRKGRLRQAERLCAFDA